MPPRKSTLPPWILEIGDEIERRDDGTPAGWAATIAYVLESLDRIEKAPRLRAEADYAVAHRIKRWLGSADCHAFQAQHTADTRARVARAESAWGQTLWRYNRRLLDNVSTEGRTVARYLLWTRHYPGFGRFAVLEAARRLGVLRRAVDPHAGPTLHQLAVIGLEMKEGDNVFTEDPKGRMHRQYVRTIGRQAFFVPDHRWQGADPAWLASIPLLEPDYRLVSVHDGKYAARPIRLARTEKDRLWEMFHPAHGTHRLPAAA